MDKLFENVGGNQFKVIVESLGVAGLRKPPGVQDEPYVSKSSSEKLTFVNGENSECGCEIESSSGGGQYSDAVYIKLCHIHKSK